MQLLNNITLSWYEIRSFILYATKLKSSPSDKTNKAAKIRNHNKIEIMLTRDTMILSPLR